MDIDGSAYCVNTSIPDLGVQGKVCFCHTDFCNSSTYIAMNYAILYGSIIILLLVLMWLLPMFLRSKKKQLILGK